MKSVSGLSPNLDLLRAVAVSCVFFSHLYESVIRGHTQISHHFGQLGVILFFVHTSLVLMQALDRSELTGAARAKEFFIHRAFRIYPLSVVCVTIAYLAPGASWSLGDLAANLTLTMNLTYAPAMVGGLWTLPLEVQMYLALPVLYVLLRGRPFIWTVGAGIVGLVLAETIPLISKRLDAFEYVPCFFGGIIAWRLGMQRGSLPSWLWLLALVFASLPWMLSPGNTMGPRWATCISLGLAIPWFRESASAHLNAIAQTVAKYSYGIYLTHAVALTVAFKLLESEPAIIQGTVFALMAVTLPLAAYHLIERPMIRYGKKLTARRPVPLAVPALEIT
jgi:peptidoglycan/LPS O-acetylase OafA/YrhL